jgi:hypothetical protein
MATRVHLVDVYEFYNSVDTNVVEGLLRDYEIICMVKPPGGSEGAEKIAVEEDEVENARGIILDAIKTGLISKEGRFTT